MVADSDRLVPMFLIVHGVIFAQLAAKETQR